MSEIKILIVEDDIVIANDLTSIVQNEGYQVIKTAYNYHQAIKAIDSYEIDLIILDVNLSDKYSGIDVANYIVQHKQIPFIFLTSYSTKNILDEAKKTKPAGYIVKPFDEKTLITTIEIAVFNFYQNHKAPNAIPVLQKLNEWLMDKISEREFDVLMQIYEGHTNKRIAEILFISVSTVKTHIINLYSKLDVNSRTLLLAKVRAYMK
ncbi:MAG TPA: response regulator transcription factor [Saprospiraceae bacterium]|nr:response regulator transcription factor [Saprospiraceae bacterium]HPN70951.1 response regulator transcription factor [Saprospiraceae bacterium]